MACLLIGMALICRRAPIIIGTGCKLRTGWTAKPPVSEGEQNIGLVWDLCDADRIEWDVLWHWTSDRHVEAIKYANFTSRSLYLPINNNILSIGQNHHHRSSLPAAFQLHLGDHQPPHVQF